MSQHEASLISIGSEESDLKNYKSLYEEIAQNDSKIYLDSNDIISYADETTAQCCCCKIHRRRNSFIAGGAVTKSPFNVPIYNTIWLGEMKNATDYIEYLNETRRNSFSLNKDNRSNYCRLMLGDSSSLNNGFVARDGISNSAKSKENFLQVPKQDIDDYLRRSPEFDDISKKIDEIHTLDSSVSALIYKSIEVHADILVRRFWVTLKLRLF